MSKPRKRTPLEKLQKHWGRASPNERAEFLRCIGSHSAAASDASTIHARAPADIELIANGRYLLPQTVVRIERILIRRGIGPADMAEELGFAGQGLSLTRGLAHKASLRLAIIAALKLWIEHNEKNR